MNQKLTIDEPTGSGWSFSLDGTASTDTYQAGREFTTDVDGNAFVDGQDYQVFAFHAETNQRLEDEVTYWAGPDNYRLRKDSELPDLAQITRRGRKTTRVLVVGGVESKTWPVITSTDMLFGGRLNLDGSISIARLSLIDLARIISPLLGIAFEENLPDYVPKQIWRWVSDDILPAYVPVRIWRWVADLTPPAAPSNLAVVLVPNDGRYRVTFTDNSNNEAAFRLERKVGDGLFEPYVQIPANSTQSGFLPNIDATLTYQFRLKAINDAGSSPWSNTATLQANNPAPVAPSIADKTNPRDTAINLILPPFADVLSRTITYALTGLPAGLSFNAATRAITGTLSTVGSNALTYTGTAGGQSASTTFAWEVTTPAPAPLLITSIRARVVSLSNSIKRLEVEAISSTAISVEFRFYDSAGAIGGFFPPPNAFYGPQTFGTQYDNTVLGSLPAYTKVEARQAGNNEQVYGPCTINVSSLTGNWSTLILL